MKSLKSILAAIAFVFAIGAAFATETLQTAYFLSSGECISSCVIGPGPQCLQDNNQQFFSDLDCEIEVAQVKRP